MVETEVRLRGTVFGLRRNPEKTLNNTFTVREKNLPKDAYYVRISMRFE